MTRHTLQGQLYLQGLLATPYNEQIATKYGPLLATSVKGLVSVGRFFSRKGASWGQVRGGGGVVGEMWLSDADSPMLSACIAGTWRAL